MQALLLPRHCSTELLLQAGFSLLSAKQEWAKGFFGGDASTFCRGHALCPVHTREHHSGISSPPREAAAGWHHPPSPSQQELVMGSISSPSLGPPGPAKLTSLDQKLQLLVPLLSATLMAFKLICGVFLPNKPVGVLNGAKETRDEAQGQLKASLKTKKPSKTSSPAAKLSAGPIRR